VISEADVEKAVDFLRTNAREAAQARAEYLYLEAHLKSLKATLKARSRATSNAAAEDEALASEEYRVGLEGYKAAVEQDAFYRFKREAASALIDAWRTQQSNLRAEGKAYG
jgi:hypothetical protein